MPEKDEIIYDHTITEEMIKQVNDGEYVCAHCWSQMSVRADFKDGKERFQAYCLTCGGNHGMVTKEYAEMRKTESGGELEEVQKNLSAAMGIKH